MTRALETAAAVLAGVLQSPGLWLRSRLSRAAVTGQGSGIAVSMTSYGKRLLHVHLVLESIARGSTKPDVLVLWLSEEDPPPRLTAGLRRLQARGLSIRTCPDLLSHKKYFPFATSSVAADLDLVTADDDVFYPRDWLEGLRKGLREHTAVWCYRAREMVLEGNSVAPYRSWPLSRATGPSFGLVPTGVSGVAYPRALMTEVGRRGDGFVQTAPTADDLWLHATAVELHVPVRQVSARRHFAVSPFARGPRLMAQNIGVLNDEVVTKLYRPELIRRITGDDGLGP